MKPGAKSNVSLPGWWVGNKCEESSRRASGLGSRDKGACVELVFLILLPMIPGI
jgi:hypothetical protein